MSNNKITIINDKYEWDNSGELVDVASIIIDGSLKKMLDIVKYNEGYDTYTECVNKLLVVGINEVYGDFGDDKILMVNEKFEMSNNLEIVEGITVVINGEFKDIIDSQIENNSDCKTCAHVVNDLMLRGIKSYTNKYKK